MLPLCVCVSPGMASRVWKVELLRDSLEEAEESFEVNLDSPVAAILGRNTKAIVTIMDTRNGQPSIQTVV